MLVVVLFEDAVLSMLEDVGASDWVVVVVLLPPEKLAAKYTLSPTIIMIAMTTSEVLIPFFFNSLTVHPC